MIKIWSDEEDYGQIENVVWYIDEKRISAIKEVEHKEMLFTINGVDHEGWVLYFHVDGQKFYLKFAEEIDSINCFRTLVRNLKRQSPFIEEDDDPLIDHVHDDDWMV